jgi:hypothetical protein
MILALLVPAALVAALAKPAAPHPVIQAGWRAQAGPALFRGNLSAQAATASGNAVVGSWTLVNDEGAVTMHGTWSGKKIGAGWRGTWRAQVEPGGGSFVGTWQGTPPAEFHGKTFEDLLRASAEVQISGYWTSNGGGRGAWWLRVPPPP